MRLVKPPLLHKGDIVGIVSPSLPLLPQFKAAYAQGLKEIERLGFQVKEGKTLSLKHWWSGGNPKQQADDINAMFQDDEIKAIFASSGGYSGLGVLEYLDYEAIRLHPKPFIGMSDMTNYHLALFTKTGLVGFHMDEVCFGMGMNWQKTDPASQRQVRTMTAAALMQAKPLGTVPALRPRKTWKEGRAKGRLIGGNLASLGRLVGTPYFPSLDTFNGAIFFWEAVGLHRYDIYQILCQLKYHGVFEKVSGMLVGTVTAVQPTRDKGIKEPTVKETVLEVLKPYDFPILAGLDFGHYTLNLPMPIGAEAAINATEQTFELTETITADNPF